MQHRQLIDDNISKIMIEVIERCLGSKAFIRTWISRWESNITDGCLASLRKLKQPYKYIGNSILILYLIIIIKESKLKHSFLYICMN